MAMCNCSNKVVKLLLGCNNIKIDTQDFSDRTALHYACRINNVEGVRVGGKGPSLVKKTRKLRIED